ncbi:MAG: hypothetical protein ACM3PP_00100 [Candidatus Saccharibacteria bacterium]
MPKQNFISVPVSDSTKSIFDEFVERMDTTKTAALSDMLDIYMIATNENLYWELKKKHLNVESVKEMIISKGTAFENKEASNDYIFMKLGINPINNLDADDTIKLYMNDEKQRGYTWFSTSALTFGMSKKQVKYFNNLINRAQEVRILFASNAWGNDIGYSARIIEIVSSQEEQPCPESGASPKILKDEYNKIWIKIQDIRRENDLSASQFQVKTTGSRLDKVIFNTQFHFGYVSKL